MPKLDGVEEKYWGEYKIDKENEDTVYSDEKHVYIDKKDNSQYISVTTLIHNYTQAFDEEFWTAYKALEQILDIELFSMVKKSLLTTKKFNKVLLKKFGIDEQVFLDAQNEIKAEYERKRNESCTRGTAIHAEFENSFYNKTTFDFEKFGYADLSGTYDCKKNYYKLDLENGVYPEFLISKTSKDGLLKIAGQIDLLVKKGNDIHIIDWKGLDVETPILTSKGWKTMGTLTLQDKVFDRDGNPVKILHISEEHHNPCFELRFNTGEKLVADEDHRWLVSIPDGDGLVEKVMTTKELHFYIKDSQDSPRIYNAKPLNTDEPCEAPYIIGNHITSEYLLSNYKYRHDFVKITEMLSGRLRNNRVSVRFKNKWQADEFAAMLYSIGVKATTFRFKKFWMCRWNKNWEKLDNRSYRKITAVVPVQTVTTKCIEVDSPTHTYLAGERLIVTHNTNKEIKKTSYYNKSTKRHSMMKYPLNNIMDTNFWHYTLQLSLYGYLLQQINPDFNIKSLKIVHIDHDGEQHVYDVEYLKSDVERMLKHYKKKLKLEQEYAKLKPVIS